jgi:hypothetical protein
VTVKARVRNTNNEWSALTEAEFSIPADDTDLDTLSDAWEVTWFTNLSQNAAGDFDGDGHSNADELFIGTDPTDRASRFMLSPVATGSTITIGFPAAVGPDYVLEYSDDLENWMEVEEYTTDIGTITFTPTILRRYYRVVAQ